MAIMVTSDVRGQTPEGYDAMMAKVAATLKSAQGLLVHASHPIEGGWRVVGIWECRDDATRFFATTIAPHLPDSLRPKLTFAPLHDVLRP